MRYCRFLTDSGPLYGQVVTRAGDDWIEHLLPPFDEGNISASDSIRTAEASFEPIPLASARLLAPVIPSKIVCIGRNYREHATELGNEVPKQPLLFLKPPSAIIGPEEPIRLPEMSERVDFEGELAVIIGRRATKIGPDEDISSYIRGYTVANDVTARDLQKSDGQWSRAKGFDTFCPLGPVVSNEVDPASGLTIETRLNGDRRQNGNTLDLIFDVPFLLRYITAAMTLMPGDVILTGTPAGVSAMRPGDRVEVTVSGIGTLENPVLA